MLDRVKSIQVPIGTHGQERVKYRTSEFKYKGKKFVTFNAEASHFAFKKNSVLACVTALHLHTMLDMLIEHNISVRNKTTLSQSKFCMSSPRISR